MNNEAFMDGSNTAIPFEEAVKHVLASFGISTVTNFDVPVAKLQKEGWYFQEFSQMKPEYWEYVLKAYGEDGKDYYKVTETTYPNGFMRGQLFIPPTAPGRIKAYRVTNPLPE